MDKEKSEEATLEWYAVKLIYEHIISGDPNPEKIDEDYNTDVIYEESIMLVKAESFNHAYTIAENKAKENELEFINPYDEKVSYQYAEAIDCFHLFDEELTTGTELYSRFISVSKDLTRNEFIDQFYPETLEDE
jgi:hypothetical protein